MSDLGPGVLALLCALGAALLMWRPGRRFVPLWAAVALLLTLGPPTLRLARSGEVREYTFAHYHLGARWFGALGYEDIYAQTLAAGGPPADGVRDLHSYAIGPSPVEARASSFSDPAWEAFRADVRALAPRQDPRSWRSWYRDKGYNATPAWTATFGRLLGARPAGSAWFACMGWLDLLLLGLGLGALGSAYGVRAALLVGAGIATFYGSRDNLVAGPLQLDWLAASLAGLAALKRERPLLGGALLGWAAVSRLFPALLLVGPALALLRGRRPLAPLAPMLAGAALVLALGIGLGCTTPRGPAAWGEFAGKITVHAEQHALGDRRVGLAPLVAWSPVGDRSDAEARAERTERWGFRASRARVLAGLAALLWGWGLLRGLRRARDEDEPGDLVVQLVLLGLPLVFALGTLSRYYMLLPMLALLGGRRLAAPVLGSCAAVWGAIALGVADADIYLLANLAWAGLGAAAVLGWARGGRL